MHNSYLILVLIFLSVCALKWSFLITPSSMTARNSKSLMFSSNPTNTQDDPIPTKVESVVPVISETPEEKYKREKLAEIAERKAAEVFVVRNTGRYECQACGYIYAESDGNPRKGIAPNTPFESLEKFRCPQCGVDKKYFVPETETVSSVYSLIVLVDINT